jgi:hypothetical protein
MARQWVILGQRKEPLHDGSGLPPENRNGRIVNARVPPTGTAERRAALDMVEDHAAPTARSAIALSSFDGTIFAEPGSLRSERPPANAGTKTKSFRPGRLGNVASAPTPVNPGSHARLPEMKGGVCVSTVSIVCGRDGGLPDRARADQIRATVVIADIIGRSRPGLS